MADIWLFLNTIFAVWMYRAATEELKEKNTFVWYTFVFISAWNAATVASAVL